MDNPYYEKLVSAALRFISFRPRSEKELGDFLSKKLIKWKISGEGLKHKVIERMRELGYVDDTQFAGWWVEQRSTFTPRGNTLIELELRAKGVEKEVVEAALASRGSESLLEGAKRLIAKKQATWAKLPSLARKKKIYEYLTRRGFSSGIIRAAVDEVTEKE